MRVAAPRPSIALRLFENGDQPCQRGRVETGRYRNAPPTDQLDLSCGVLHCVRCRLLDKLDPRQRQLHSVVRQGRGRKSISMACPLVILVESRQRQAILTAELRPTQTTLRVRCHDPRHLRAAATRTTINDWNGTFTHAFSESSSKPHGKNGLARRDTLVRRLNHQPRNPSRLHRCCSCSRAKGKAR